MNTFLDVSQQYRLLRSVFQVGHYVMYVQYKGNSNKNRHTNTAHTSFCSCIIRFWLPRHSLTHAHIPNIQSTNQQCNRQLNCVRQSARNLILNTVHICHTRRTKKCVDPTKMTISHLPLDVLTNWPKTEEAMMKYEFFGVTELDGSVRFENN